MSSFTDPASEILAIARNLQGRVADIDSIAARAIASGCSLEDFRRDALSRIPTIKPLQRPVLSDVNVKDWAKYSLSRAIMGHATGNLSGFEAEMNQQLTRDLGRGASGFWVPPQALSRNFVAGTGTLGGFAVATENLASEFIEPLRNQSMVMNLGARVLNLQNPVTIPRQASAGTANWVSETASATLSTGNFEQLTLTPYGISALQQYSKQLLATSNPSIDLIVRDDINKILAIAIDKAALHGTGSGQPTGIASTTGIGTVSVAMLAASALGTSLMPFLVSLETAVATSNANVGSLAYLMGPKLRASCKTTAQLSSNEFPVWGGRPDGSGIVNGYRAETTNQISTNLTTGTATTICTCAFFGNWNDLLMAQFNGGATDLVVDPYTLAANGVVRLIARRWVDIGVRHPSSFCLGGGIIA